MIYRRFAPVLLVFVLVSLALTPLIDSDTLIWTENFQSVSTQWKTSNNAEELFLIENGEYVLWRKSVTGPSVVLPESGDLYGESKASLEISIDADYGGSGGLVFLAKQDGNYALVAEISGDRKYRVRKLEKGGFTELTGLTKNSGWVKDKIVKEKGQTNTVEISYAPGAIILSINQKQVWVGNEFVKHQGKCGVYVGPESRVRMDNLRVFVSEEEADRIKNDRNNNDPARSALTDIIITLRNTINAQNHEIDSLEKLSGKLQAESDKLDRSPKNVRKLSADLRAAKKEIAALEYKLKKSEKEVKALKSFKDNIKSSKEGDIVISLTNALADEKEKRMAVEKENRELKAKLAALEAEEK